MVDLGQLVGDFAKGMVAADGRQPQAANVRSKLTFQKGIGPHSEAETVRLVGMELESLAPDSYGGRLHFGVSYPEATRQKCDLCIGTSAPYEWAIEIKMLRILGDNGKANDNILMHILSPYPAHRSALTDCEKLVGSSLGESKAILIYGYDAPDWPLELAVSAFEALARTRVKLGARCESPFEGLAHPVHSRGGVFAWQLLNSDV